MDKFAIVTSILACLACSVATEYLPNIKGEKSSLFTSGTSAATKLQETIQIDLTKTKNIADGLTKLVDSTVKNTTNQKSESPLLPAITKNVANTLKHRVKEVEKLQEKIAEGVKKAKNMTGAFAAEVTSSVKTTIDKHTTTIENIVKKATGAGGVGSCLSFSVNLQKIGDKIVSDTVACAENSLVRLITKAKKVVDEMGHSIITLNDIALKTASCITDTKRMVPCVTSVWILLAKHSAIFLTRLVTEAAALNIAFLTFHASFAACGFTSTIASLANSAHESAAKTAKCVSELS